jgi:8-oxo-dGTP pyrophosphatase MutT (NUDIX family)
MENSLKLTKVIGLNESEPMNVTEANDPGYLSWKRKNVTIRGVKEVGEENNAGAMLGRGLYTAFLSNKSLAKEYGTVYFVLNAIPKNPKVFNTLNEWEIWFYNTLVNAYSKEKGKNFPDRRDFDANTTIEDEMQKMGFDGIIIKGREMVNFNPPDNVIYFKNEHQLINYYETVVNGLNEANSKYTVDMAPEELIRRVPFLRHFKNYSDDTRLKFQHMTYNENVELYNPDGEPVLFKQFNLSSEFNYSVVDMYDGRHRFMLSLKHQTWLMPPEIKEPEQALLYRVMTMAMTKQMESFDYTYDEVLEQETLTKEQWNEIINNINKSFIELEEYLDDVLPVELDSHLGEGEVLDEEKKKADRCLRIARRKYDKPSAYRSGAIVRCRKGKIWKDLKEEDVNDAPEDVKTLIYKAHDAITRRKGKDYAPDVHELQAWINDHLESEEGLEEAKKTDYSKEKKDGLHGWFSRRGGGGSKGWVDCNTCTTVGGKKKCKACGRKDGEKRSKYPSCRPTPASCGTPGKGKKWGKTKEESYDIMNEEEQKEKKRIALLFIVIDNKVLLFKRSPEETTNPGKYGMLGGHIEKGETPEEALRREVKEEAGVEVGAFKKLKVYELDEVQLNVFYTNEFDVDNVKLDKKEHTAKKFFTLEELDEMSPEECIDTNKGIARDYNKKAQEDKQLNETLLRMKSIINR